MKKFLLLMITLLSIFLFVGCDKSKPDLASECVRIHIRANSNSSEDQAVKLKVRDAITSYLSQKLEGVKDKEQALATLNGLKQNLVNIANRVLYQSDFDYKASITLSNEHFPDRDYDGYFFPEGNYDALILRLGKGEGDNWWCVAFPPLCFVPSGGKEKVVYKSWIKEMLDKLFSGV